jgi:hypothetical protein
VLSAFFAGGVRLLDVLEQQGCVRLCKEIFYIRIRYENTFQEFLGGIDPPGYVSVPVNVFIWSNLINIDETKQK